MTLNEAITEGLLVTAVGLIIVFAVLAILMLSLMIMKTIFYKPEKPTESVKNETKVAEVSASQMPVVISNQDDFEIIAVLTAAIAASLNTSTYNLKIKSYKRIGTNSPAWNRAGVSEMINTRL